MRLTHGPVTPRKASTVQGGADVTEDDHRDRLQELEGRLDKAKAAQAPKPRADEHFSQANLAWRMVIELVSGLGIGFGIGYGLDLLLGTTPFLLVLFILLGFAAGVKTMLRTAGEIQAKRQADVSAEDEGT